MNVIYRILRLLIIIFVCKRIEQMNICCCLLSLQIYDPVIFFIDNKFFWNKYRCYIIFIPVLLFLVKMTLSDNDNISRFAFSTKISTESF